MLRLSKPQCFLVVLGLVIGAGCRRSAPNPVTASAVKPVSNPAATPRRAETSTTANPEINNVEQQPQHDAAPSDTVGEAEIAVIAPTMPISTERVLLIAPAGPIIVDLQLAIDGRPHTEAMERLKKSVA